MARDYSKPLKPHMKPTMTVRCKVCGGLMQALVEPYCYTDQDFLKAIEKYKKKKWLSIQMEVQEKYKLIYDSPCCERGIGYRPDKHDDKPLPLPKKEVVHNPTLF